MSIQPDRPAWTDEDEAAWTQLRNALRVVAACTCFEHTDTTTGTPIYDAAAYDNGFAPMPNPGMNRPDLRMLPLTGRQSPGEAW